MEPRQEDGDKPHPYIGTIRMYDWNYHFPLIEEDIY